MSLTARNGKTRCPCSSVTFSLQKFHNEKELNDAHELIHRLSQYDPNHREATSFMQELQDDFGVCPSGVHPFNSTVREEESDDCRMDDDDDGVGISPTPSSSQINEKCLLDELLQTEEVKRDMSRRRSDEHLFPLHCSSNARSFWFTSSCVLSVWN